jgi:hypothetical protein
VFALGSGLALALATAACDKSGPLANLDASSTWAVVPSATETASSPAATAFSAPSRDAGRVMPPRPVPTSSPTVLITMSQDVQLQAIQYMAAMQAPQPGDAPADATYGQQIADQLRGVGRTEVISSGRRIDILLEKGCVATLPRESVARHTAAASLTTLLAHGVLVVRCADKNLQCLQSTRDADDVLCTRK